MMWHNKAHFLWHKYSCNKTTFSCDGKHDGILAAFGLLESVIDLCNNTG